MTGLRNLLMVRRSKIQGKWTNPVQVPTLRSTKDQRRSGDAQGGADIRFTQESEIQRSDYVQINE